jgi:lysyl-tRNA synthetase class 2
MTKSPPEWQPAATTEVLLARSSMMDHIRSFFKERGVMEVETPVLGRSTATDPHLSSFVTKDNNESWYLQTSPEFHMKRLLAAGMDSIFQICKSFRQGELGTLHNPEFSMLEWYRIGFDHHALMDEVEELVAGILGLGKFARVSYRSLFEGFFGMNPHQASIRDLTGLVTENVAIDASQLKFSSEAMAFGFCLDLLMSERLESSLIEPTFVFDYPIAQAALSTSGLSAQGDRVAQRFELYIQNMEIANGYLELRDADELRDRFSADNTSRKLENLPGIPADQHLISAMVHGLPECAGVALGIDRLLMLVTGVKSVSEVLTFPASIA